MSAKTTITFSVFSADGKITIKTDSERNGGKTGFAYGQKAYFRVYSAEPEKLKVASSAGIVAFEGFCLSELEPENVAFTDSQEYKFDFPVESVTAHEWFGRNLGSIAISGADTIACETAPDPVNGSVGLASVTVAAKYALYSLTLGVQSKDEFPVLVDVRLT